MQDWTAGYLIDIPYTCGYYQELNPLWLRLAFANAGVAFPETGTACELGYGQGLSTTIHASASNWKWYGTDFSPSQAGFARHLAQHCGASPVLHADAFVDFVARDDLPDFDFIGLHGIWTWISAENRRHLIDFIRRKLKVGGVVYISYNAMPGWAPLLPLRQLLLSHVRSRGNNMNQTRVLQALEFAKRVMETDPAYPRTNPQFAERLESLFQHGPQYVAHEYLNQHWDPMAFSEVAMHLRDARLDYVCNANTLDQIEALNTSAAQQALLADIDDRVLREDVRDLMVNRSFRKDCWAKGARTMSPIEREDSLRAERVVLSVPRSTVKLTVRGTSREATMIESINLPLLECLQHHDVFTLGELEDQLLPKGITAAQTREAVMVLAGAGYLSAAQDEAVIAQVQARTQAYNRHLMQYARYSGEIEYLASPVTGGGIPVDRIGRLILLAISEGYSSGQWAGEIWKCLERSGQRLVKDGQTIETTEANLTHLETLVPIFESELLPTLRGLKVI